MASARDNKKHPVNIPHNTPIGIITQPPRPYDGLKMINKFPIIAPKDSTISYNLILPAVLVNSANRVITPTAAIIAK